MTDSFDPQPKISLEPYLLKAEDVAKFVNADFDLHKDIINQACKKVAMLNEKTAEQALILKLNNHIAEQQRVIDQIKAAICPVFKYEFWQLAKVDDGRVLLLFTEDEYSAIKRLGENNG